MTIEVKKEYSEWLSSNDTGISSETMFSALTGIPVKRCGTPCDLSDVGRCIRMLRKLPDLRDKLHLVIEKHKEWMPFIDCWEELEREYDKCVKWEALSSDEQKKQKRQKYFTVPNEMFWNLMKQLEMTSRYIRGMRMQNSSSSFSNKPPKKY